MWVNLGDDAYVILDMIFMRVQIFISYTINILPIFVSSAVYMHAAAGTNLTASFEVATFPKGVEGSASMCSLLEHRR